MAALVLVAGFEVVNANTQVNDARSQAALAEASIGPGSLVAHLQDERNRAAINLIGLGDAAELAQPDNPTARAATDPAATEFRADTDRRGGVVRAAFEPAWAAFENLDALRADIDAYDGPMDTTNDEFANDVFQRYTDMIVAFFDGTSQVALTVDDASLRNGAEIVDATTRQSEMRARLVRSVVLASLTGRIDEPEVRQEVAALFDRSQQYDEAIRTNSSGPYAGVADATFAEDGVKSFNQQLSGYLAGDPVNITTLLGAVATDPTIGYAGLREKAGERLSAEATRLQDDATARMRLFAGIAAGGLLIALLVTWLASRSITRPLRSLKAQAEEMAGTRLPAAVRQILDTPPGEDVVIPEVEPIKVKTRDEVSEVAAALSEVQASAVDLAVEQAVLRRNISDSYINLGRRNQNLLTRQLDFITELERNETDPDGLEGLFRLDHLATRMRRNAESLLVLAGVEPPRQWSAPVKMADVVRASLGEVEDYQRVVVRHLEPATVTGAVAADVAHVLAELVENALSFSPPDQTVEVRGRLDPTGYTVAISDNGLGMAPADLERANRRLAGKESFTVAPSRYLGHYVAGHLASRLDIVVELQDSPAGGITARIDIPMGLLADDEIDRTVAPARAPAAAAAEPAPVVSGPAPAASTSDTTPGGLPRRGERTQPLVTGGAAPGLEAPAPVPVAESTAPTVLPAPPPPPVRPVMEPAEPAVAAGSPVAPAAPTPVPPTGFGGLAVTPGPSMYTVAARQARNGATSTSGVGAADATPSGLARRVPGAQRPDAGLFGRPSQPAPEEPVRTSPEDVYSFLSSFQSGVARGRADAASDTPTTPEDEQ
jgi:signal transduction histidine kinase